MQNGTENSKDRLCLSCSWRTLETQVQYPHANLHANIILTNKGSQDMLQNKEKLPIRK